MADPRVDLVEDESIAQAAEERARGKLPSKGEPEETGPASNGGNVLSGVSEGEENTTAPPPLHASAIEEELGKSMFNVTMLPSEGGAGDAADVTIVTGGGGVVAEEKVEVEEGHGDQATADNEVVQTDAASSQGGGGEEGGEGGRVVKDEEGKPNSSLLPRRKEEGEEGEWQDILGSGDLLKKVGL